MKKYWILKGLKIMFFVSIGVFLFGYIAMRLWNGLVPDLFNGPIINWCQAVGLLILSKIFFGGFGGRGWGGNKKCGAGNSHWRERFEEKMSKMTPEERENFKKKCGANYWNKNSEDTPIIKE